MREILKPNSLAAKTDMNIEVSIEDIPKEITGDVIIMYEYSAVKYGFTLDKNNKFVIDFFGVEGTLY